MLHGFSLTENTEPTASEAIGSLRGTPMWILEATGTVRNVGRFAGGNGLLANPGENPSSPEGKTMANIEYYEKKTNYKTGYYSQHINDSCGMTLKEKGPFLNTTDQLGREIKPAKPGPDTSCDPAVE
jgi:hypothetical protein